MSDTAYTDDELREFDRLSQQTSSRDQVTRVNGRLGLSTFVKKHGKAKCDAMWAAIMAAEKAKGQIKRRG